MLLPLSQGAAQDVLMEVEALYVQGPQPGTNGRYALTGPGFDLPLRDVRWGLYAPADLRLDDFGPPAKFLRQKFRIALHRIEVAGLVGRLQMPCLEVTVDPVPGDTILHPVNRAISQIENRPRPLAPKFGIDLAHRPAQAGDQLPAIAP